MCCGSRRGPAGKGPARTAILDIKRWQGADTARSWHGQNRPSRTAMGTIVHVAKVGPDQPCKLAEAFNLLLCFPTLHCRIVEFSGLVMAAGGILPKRTGRIRHSSPANRPAQPRVSPAGECGDQPRGQSAPGDGAGKPRRPAQHPRQRQIQHRQAQDYRDARRIEQDVQDPKDQHQVQGGAILEPDDQIADGDALGSVVVGQAGRSVRREPGDFGHPRDRVPMTRTGGDCPSHCSLGDQAVASCRRSSRRRACTWGSGSSPAASSAWV